MNETLKRLSTNPLLARGGPIVVIGAQFGDEGKGKIVHVLAGLADSAVRYGGGCNAGHTIVDEQGRKFVTHLLPASALWGKPSYCARGVFMSFEQLTRELNDLSDINPPYFIDRGCPIFLPWHLTIEQWLEHVKSKDAQDGKNDQKTGTTGKGMVGYAMMQIMRMTVRAGDLLLPSNELAERMMPLYEALKPIAEHMKHLGLQVDYPHPLTVCASLQSARQKFRDHVTDVSWELSEQLNAGKRLIFEGAQATGLDMRWGTVPFTSPGLSLASGASEGCGLPMSRFSSVLMVAKLFPTRVGNGPFVSEMWQRHKAERFATNNPDLFQRGAKREEFLATMLEKISGFYGRERVLDLLYLAQYLQVLGDERGATTGRGRSIGALDLQWLRYVSRINGATDLALTRLDMASQLNQIPVVTSYRFHGETLPGDALPDERKLEEVEPVLEWFPGWQEDISDCRRVSDLPQNAKKLIQMINERTGLSIPFIGVGPRMDQIVSGR